jgi:hypothetical protein
VTTVDNKVAEWRKRGDHLPEFMRDFHDQKNLFKTIHEQAVTDPRSPDWIAAHTYTLDAFLFFMARHGYVLKKTTAKLPFSDIDKTLRDGDAARREKEGAILRQILGKSTV